MTAHSRRKAFGQHMPGSLVSVEARALPPATKSVSGQSCHWPT